VEGRPRSNHGGQVCQLASLSTITKRIWALTVNAGRCNESYHTRERRHQLFNDRIHRNGPRELRGTGTVQDAGVTTATLKNTVRRRVQWGSPE
jgi:hypothetical protein